MYLKIPELDATLTNSHAYMYSSSRTGGLVDVLVLAVVFGLLVLPLIVIYRLDYLYTPTSTVKSIGVLAAFAVIFSGAVSMVTRMSQYEIF